MAGFDRKSADRIAKGVKAFERSPRNSIPQPRGPRGIGGGVLKYAKLTSSMSANTSPTATGQATGKLQSMDSDGNLTTVGDNVPIFSNHDKTIANGSYVVVGLIDGNWCVVDVYSCNNLS